MSMISSVISFSWVTPPLLRCQPNYVVNDSKLTTYPQLIVEKTMPFTIPPKMEVFQMGQNSPKRNQKGHPVNCCLGTWLPKESKAQSSSFPPRSPLRQRINDLLWNLKPNFWRQNVGKKHVYSPAWLGTRSPSHLARSFHSSSHPLGSASKCPAIGPPSPSAKSLGTGPAPPSWATRGSPDPTFPPRGSATDQRSTGPSTPKAVAPAPSSARTESLPGSKCGWNARLKDYLFW